VLIWVLRSGFRRHVPARLRCLIAALLRCLITAGLRCLVAILLGWLTALRRLLVLLRIGQLVATGIELHRRRRLLRRELPLILIATVSDLAETHVGRLAYGRFLHLEVRGLLELEHAGDDVRRHRLDLGVVDPHIGVIEAAARGNPVFGFGQLPLQLQEVLVALEIGVRLNADDQISYGTGEGGLDIGTLLAWQRTSCLL